MPGLKTVPLTTPASPALVSPTYRTAQQRKLAEGLMNIGTSGAPVQSPLEGFGRSGQAIVGALLAKHAENQLEERRTAASETMAQALKAGKPWVPPEDAYREADLNPAFGETSTNPAVPGATPAVKAGQPWPGTGGVPAMAAALSKNPDTAAMGFNMQANQIANEQAMARALAEKQATENIFLKGRGDPSYLGRVADASTPAKLAVKAGAPGRAPVPGVDIPKPVAVINQEVDKAGRVANAGVPAAKAIKGAVPGRAERPGIDRPYDPKTFKQLAQLAAEKATATQDAKSRADRVKAFPAARNALTSAKSKHKIVSGHIDTALKQADRFSTGLPGQILSNLGGTGARDLRATLQSIGSHEMLSELKALKDASPSGASGMGSLSNLEGEYVRARNAALDQFQDLPELVRNLKNLKKIEDKIIEASEMAYQADWNDFLKKDNLLPGAPAQSDLDHTAKLHGITVDQLKELLAIPAGPERDALKLKMMGGN